MKALKVIGIGFGYVVFFVVCTALFVRVLFPTQQAKDFAAQRIAELTGAESVTIGDLSLTGLIPNGVEIQDLKMRLPGVKVKTADRGGSTISDARRIEVDELTVKASLSGLTSGAPDVSFDARIGTGTIHGAHYSREKDGPHVLKIEKMSDVPLGPERLFQTVSGLDIRGKLSGEVDLTIPVGERDGKVQPLFDQVAGKVDIQLGNASVWSPIFDTPQGRMALTDVDLGQVRLYVVAEGASSAPQTGDPKTRTNKRDASVLTVDASVDGPDLGVATAPRSTITFVAGGGLKEAAVNVHLALKIQDALMDKEMEDPKHPGQMIKPNVGLKYMMQANPIKSQITDGQLGLAITGTIGDVKPRTERPRVRVGGSGAGATRKMNLDHPEGEGDNGDEPKAAPTEGARSATPPPTADTNRRPVTVARPNITHPATPMGRARPAIPPPPPVVEAPPHVEPMPQPEAEPVPVEPAPGGELPEGEIDPNAPAEDPQPQ